MNIRFQIKDLFLNIIFLQSVSGYLPYHTDKDWKVESGHAGTLGGDYHLVLPIRGTSCTALILPTSPLLE